MTPDGDSTSPGQNAEYELQKGLVDNATSHPGSMHDYQKFVEQELRRHSKAPTDVNIRDLLAKRSLHLHDDDDDDDDVDGDDKQEKEKE